MTEKIDPDKWSAEALGIWHFSLLALSLDQALPLFEDLGLRLADKTTFQHTLRRCFEASWKVSLPAAELDLVKSVLSALDEKLGPAGVTSFVAWFDAVMRPADAVRARALVWDQLLTAPAKGPLPTLVATFRAERPRRSGSASTDASASANASPNPAATIDPAATVGESPGVETVPGLADDPTSIWDRQVYTTHRFDQEDGLQPMAWLDIALRHASFLRAWNRTMKSSGASVPERQKWFDWAQAQAKKARIPAEELGDLDQDFGPLPQS